jgi:hypothetical protein
VAGLERRAHHDRVGAGLVGYPGDLVVGVAVGRDEGDLDAQLTADRRGARRELPGDLVVRLVLRRQHGGTRRAGHRDRVGSHVHGDDPRALAAGKPCRVGSGPVARHGVIDADQDH